MKTKKASFRIILRPEPEGGYTVMVPSLPGCITYGEDIQEAKKMAQDAIKAYIVSLSAAHSVTALPDKLFMK